MLLCKHSKPEQRTMTSDVLAQGMLDILSLAWYMPALVMERCRDATCSCCMTAACSWADHLGGCSDAAPSRKSFHTGSRGMPPVVMKHSATRGA